MRIRNPGIVLSFVLGAFLALPAIATESAPTLEVTIEKAPGTTNTTASCDPNRLPEGSPFAVTNPLQDAFDAAGCSASISCIHGGTVSCSSTTPGTCSSAYGGCGQVTCNGSTTRCAGYCYWDHHCYGFCNGFGGVCEYGCCECG
ncbi:MAG: hypothetical protein K0U98_17510 [Deltaproteobacteria bacterium]|nr:hypothetical protein [Deltaproteobacteria bacterium]